MRLWQLAGLCSDSVRAATVVNWMVMGVYFTRELLHKMKKVESPCCLGCDSGEKENLSHFLIHCGYYQEICEQYLPQFLEINIHLIEILQNEEKMMLSILDPLHSKLDNIAKSWKSSKMAYEISRQFCYSMHRKREKLYKEPS